MTPGFHLGIPSERYHADPADQPSLSSSLAKILTSESPRKAWYSHPRLNPDHRDKHEAKFDLGTAAHALLLENDRSKLVLVNADDWRTKAAKEQRDAANAIGKTAILERHYDALAKMVDIALAFIAESEIADYWHEADSEVTGIAQDAGATLRCRYDRLTRDRLLSMDYKSTEDVSPDGFGRQIIRMGYHFQDAFYRRVARLNGIPDQKFVFLAQSVEEPHECTLHGCDPAMQEIADAEVQRAINLWRECMTKKKWPSYPTRIHWVMPSSWMMQEHEMRLQEAA